MTSDEIVDRTVEIATTIGIGEALDFINSHPDKYGDMRALQVEASLCEYLLLKKDSDYFFARLFTALLFRILSRNKHPRDIVDIAEIFENFSRPIEGWEFLNRNLITSEVEKTEEFRQQISFLRESANQKNNDGTAFERKSKQYEKIVLLKNIVEGKLIESKKLEIEKFISEYIGSDVARRFVALAGSARTATVN